MASVQPGSFSSMIPPTQPAAVQRFEVLKVGIAWIEKDPLALLWGGEDPHFGLETSWPSRLDPRSRKASTPSPSSPAPGPGRRPVFCSLSPSLSSFKELGALWLFFFFFFICGLTLISVTAFCLLTSCLVPEP